MKVFAVIPAWQEAPRIANTIRGILPYIKDILVVDDGSLDGTAEAAAATGVSVIRHRLNRGQGASLKTGTLAALARGADIVVHVDADGQHDPTTLSTLIQPILSGEADVVFGSRFLGVEPEGMPWQRRAFLRIARRIFNGYLLGIPQRVTDPQSGLRAFRREAALRLDFRQDRMAHCSEILRLVTHSAWRWREVPVKVCYTPEVLAKGVKMTGALDIAWHLFIGLFHKK